MTSLAWLFAGIAGATIVLLGIYLAQDRVATSNPAARARDLPDASASDGSGATGLYLLAQHLLGVVEAQSEELATHKRNFGRYRRGTRIAFWLLATAGTVGGWYVTHQGDVQQTRITRAVREVTVNNCRAGNDLRGGLRIVVTAALPDRPAAEHVKQLALDTFADRDCDRLAGRIPTP